MKFWNRCIWWIAAFVAVACFFALTQTAQTSSPPTSSTASSEPHYFTVQHDGEPGVSYGVSENGQSVIYHDNLSDR